MVTYGRSTTETHASLSWALGDVSQKMYTVIMSHLFVHHAGDHSLGNFNPTIKEEIVLLFQCLVILN